MVLSKHPTSGLTSFIILLFHHAPVVFLLTQCCEGQIQVIGPLQSLTVMIGNDIILPCHLKPASDASGMTFEWSRPDLKPRFVHVWHEGQDLHVNQHSSFKGRTSVDIAKLKHGDISLKLITVKHTDTGKYRCYFPDLDKETTVQLVVGSASLPVLSLAGIDRSTSEVVLQCESAGWYPEPELLWLDGEGKLLSAGPTETLIGPDDLYTVSSRVTVEKRHSNNITCRVQQRNTNQSRETHIHVPDDFFGSPCSSTACIAVSLAACVMSVFVLTFAVWKGSRNKLKATVIPQENMDLMAESEKMKDIENKMIKLEEELQRKEKEHKIMVGILMQQKEELEKQKHQLQLQHKKMEELVEENEKDLKSVEKEIKENAQDKKITSSLFLQLTPIISKYKWGLTDGVNTFDELILSTEKLVEKLSNTDLH